MAKDDFPVLECLTAKSYHGVVNPITEAQKVRKTYSITGKGGGGGVLRSVNVRPNEPRKK